MTDRDRPYLGEGRLQGWLDLAAAAGIALPEHLEQRRRRWHELADSSRDGTGDGVQGPTDPGPGRGEGPQP